MGEWQDAPSGINREKKRELLRREGVEFDGNDRLVLRDGIWFEEFLVVEVGGMDVNVRTSSGMKEGY